MSKERIYLNLNVILLSIGILAVIFYFLHVILGSIHYPGYDFLSQAVSDLTSDSSPSKVIARFFSSLYGILSSLVMIGFLYTFRNEKIKILKIGVYLLSTMYITSAVGYALFPLSSNTDINNFQNVMHIVVTIAVVLLTISSLILLAISFKKMNRLIYFILTVLTFAVLMIGSISIGVVPSAYFGLAERFSVFSVVLYLLFISYFNYDYHKKTT
ncbi:MAG: DUF998 domain-containing protein [Tenericutes bacterium HGW-Tenericutes-2]|jgi:hypothetical protein|nr:MAG: DUF998 domain-containing protein [Tenericutes bacterium HGW-Tenericutes-2]